MGAAGAILGLARPLRADGDHGGGLRVWSPPAPVLLDTPYPHRPRYGVITYFVMNWLVVPLRFGTRCRPSRCRSHPAVRAHRAGRHPHRADRRAVFAAAGA
jgi:hypothetical protein